MASPDRIDELKKRYDENPRRFFASLANEYRKAGDLDQAIALCQQHLAEQPGNMNGHVVYGQALFEAGRNDEARTTFETALTLDPENLIALRHLGDIACQTGANEEAREWYKRVLDADPRNDEIIALLENLEQEEKRVSLSALEAAPRETPAGGFKPPTVITPLATKAVEQPTPVMPIETVETVKIPAVTPPAPEKRESIGLMDISLDFETNVPVTAETPVMPMETVETDFPAFEEVSLGTPAQPQDAVAPPAELGVDPFATPETVEFEPWNPPGVDFGSSALDAGAGLEQLPESALEPVAEAFAEPVTQDLTGDMLFGDSIPAEPAPPFVTETMAELYLQQGFTAEALDVYRQLSAANPDDENLKERVRKLEHGDRTSLSLDVVADETIESPDGAVPLGAMIDFGATPVVPVDAVPAPTAEPAAPVESSPPPSLAASSARSYFAALSARRAVQGRSTPSPVTSPVTPSLVASGVTSGVTSPVTPSPVTSPVTASPVTSPVTPSPVTSSHSSLDDLFGGGSISTADESMALAFSQVSGAVEMGTSSVQGKPTAPAATELSLDSVFREADSHATPTAVPRQSQTLRFDQFFATAGEDAAPAQPPAISAPAGEPGSPAELQQFQSWLTGLKKP